MFPLKDKRIRIGGWWSTDPNLVSDSYVKMIADVGADFIMSSEHTDTKQINELLTYCDKYGVECVLMDRRIYGDENADVAGVAKDYAHHESFVGHMIKDEPGTDEMPMIRRLYDKCNEALPGRKAYINLLPMYANAAQLKFGAGAAAIEYYDNDPKLYEKHLDEYCRIFDTPYICVDVYPCRVDENNKRTMYPGYLENINVIAKCCRKYDRELWIMVQNMMWYACDNTPSEAELRWQFFTMLSFGAKAIFHFCLATPTGHTPGLITKQGTKSDLYYPAQRMHRYLKAIEDVYLQYDNIGAFCLNDDDAHAYMQFTNQMKDFKPVKEIASEQRLLVGCFEKQDKNGYAFTLVNMEAIDDCVTAHVKLKLDGKKVTVYADTMSYTIAPVDGYYEFDIPFGEGLFVTVE